MKSFFIIFLWIIVAILLSNPIILHLIGVETNVSIFSFIVFLMILDSFIIIFLIKKFYDTPIKNLEITIKRFLVWDLKDSEIKIDKSLNPNLNFILTFFSRTINTLKNIKDEFLHGQEIKWEVELAREIQEKMLAKPMVEIPSLQVVVRSKPAWELGWDSHDIIKQEDNYYIYVWDATGHGVWAGLIMVMVNALISAISKIYKSGADILIKTNSELKPRVKANLLMSMLLLRWNEKEKRLFMTWAWHEHLMIYKQSTWKVYKIKTGWVALGMVKDITKIVKEQEIKFEKWDIVILYSDWITEAINTKKRDGTEDLFGEHRVEEAIMKAPNMKQQKYKTAASVFNNITIQLSKFMWYKFTQLDDITLFVIQYKPDWYDTKDDFDSNLPRDLITEWYWN